MARGSAQAQARGSSSCTAMPFVAAAGAASRHRTPRKCSDSHAARQSRPAHALSPQRRRGHCQSQELHVGAFQLCRAVASGARHSSRETRHCQSLPERRRRAERALRAADRRYTITLGRVHADKERRVHAQRQVTLGERSRAILSIARVVSRSVRCGTFGRSEPCIVLGDLLCCRVRHTRLRAAAGEAGARAGPRLKSRHGRPRLKTGTRPNRRRRLNRAGA